MSFLCASTAKQKTHKDKTLLLALTEWLLYQDLIKAFALFGTPYHLTMNYCLLSSGFILSIHALFTLLSKAISRLCVPWDKSLVSTPTVCSQALSGVHFPGESCGSYILFGSVQKLNMSWAAKISRCYTVQPGILFWLEMCNLFMKIIMYVCMSCFGKHSIGIKQYQPQA